MKKLFSLIVALGCVVTAFAKLPELDAVFWGTVLHHTNQPLVPDSAGNIVILAKLNGITIAQTSVAPGASQYVLKVPKDDGLSPRLIGTSRAGERVHVFVRSNVLDTEYEAAESVTAGGLSISSVKGDLVLQSLSVSSDLSGGGAMTLPAWLASYSLPSNSGNLDSDGDGASNAAEFAADTDPKNSAERFKILEVTRSAGSNFIKFGPIRPSRLYTIWCSENLGSSDWSNVGQVTPGVTGDFFLFGHSTPASSSVFYKLQVAAP